LVCAEGVDALQGAEEGTLEGASVAREDVELGNRVKHGQLVDPGFNAVGAPCFPDSDGELENARFFGGTAGLVFGAEALEEAAELAGIFVRQENRVGAEAMLGGLRLTMALPRAVLGPVLLSALRRLAAI
jgi:hypothetical protein